MVEESHTAGSGDERQGLINDRFVNALKQALVSNRFSQRKLCTEIGVTIGTMTKYMRGSINPFKVGTEVQERLAQSLGVSLPSLLTYYRTGDYASQITRGEVTSWIRSEGAQEDIPFLLDATSAVSRLHTVKVDLEPSIKKYSWPLEILANRRISSAMQERLGLGKDVMEKLSQGEFEAETVEAFALLLNREPPEVEEAFTKQEALVDI